MGSNPHLGIISTLLQQGWTRRKRVKMLKVPVAKFSLLSWIFKAEKTHTVLYSEPVAEYSWFSFSSLRESGISWHKGKVLNIEQLCFYSPSHEGGRTELCSTITPHNPLLLNSDLRACGEVICHIYSSSTLSILNLPQRFKNVFLQRHLSANNLFQKIIVRLTLVVTQSH